MRKELESRLSKELLDPQRIEAYAKLLTEIKQYGHGAEVIWKINREGDLAVYFIDRGYTGFYRETPKGMNAKAWWQRKKYFVFKLGKDYTYMPLKWQRLRTGWLPFNPDGSRMSQGEWEAYKTEKGWE